MRKTLGILIPTLAAGLAVAALGTSVTDGVVPAVVSSGGGTASSAGGVMELASTSGQPVVGPASGGAIELQAGFWTTAPTLTAAEPVPAAGDRLAPAYPNPFNPATTVRFTLARAGPVRVDIYDVRGRLVARLVDGPLPVGPHEVTWRGTDRTGDVVSSGTYVLRLQTAQGHFHQKLTLLK
jgi:hypothetical protein